MVQQSSCTRDYLLPFESASSSEIVTNWKPWACRSGKIFLSAPRDGFEPQWHRMMSPGCTPPFDVTTLA